MSYLTNQQIQPAQADERQAEQATCVFEMANIRFNKQAIACTDNNST